MATGPFPAQEILVIGLNHRTAPLEARERFVVPLRDVALAVDRLRRESATDEAVVLSTCNRVELYVAASRKRKDVIRSLVDFFSAQSRLPSEAFVPHLYGLAGRQAAAHLFRVTVGLDSMVLGESEITAQVKQAYAIAHASGSTGVVLNRLFQRALHCAKVVRSQTRIADGQASIGSVAAALARQHFGERLARCEALLWGAGKAAETTARHLMKAGLQHLWIVNRTPDKAQGLATICQGRWLAWEEARARLARVDIAIVCTQAPHYVIDTADLELVLPQRGGRALFLVDLSVPRNIDPALARYPDTRLYNIDDLRSIAQSALSRRHLELQRCEGLIRSQVDHYWRGWSALPDKEAVSCRPIEACSLV